MKIKSIPRNIILTLSHKETIFLYDLMECVSGDTKTSDRVIARMFQDISNDVGISPEHENTLTGTIFCNSWYKPTEYLTGALESYTIVNQPYPVLEIP